MANVLKMATVADIVTLIKSGHSDRRISAVLTLATVKTFVRWLWEMEVIAVLPRVLGNKSNSLKITAESTAPVIFDNAEVELLLKNALVKTPFRHWCLDLKRNAVMSDHSQRVTLCWDLLISPDTVQPDARHQTRPDSAPHRKDSRPASQGRGGDWDLAHLSQQTPRRGYPRSAESRAVHPSER